jgi:hypothetical protein
LIQVNAIPRQDGNGLVMARSFTVSPLTAGDIAVAFPLIRAALPEIGLEAWRSFARGVVDQPSPYPAGGVGLRNEGGYLCGVLTYRIDRDLRHGTALNVDMFAALDVTGEEAATRALLSAAEEKARELRCSAVRVSLEGPAERMSGRFAAVGYHAKATVFCKTLGPPPAAA